MKDRLIIGTCNGTDRDYGIVVADCKEKMILNMYKGDNAGILCLSHDGKYLYAANESRDFRGKGSGGGISSYRIVKDGLEPVNESLSFGSRPAYLTMTYDDRFLIVANHGSHSSVTIRYKFSEGRFEHQLEHDISNIAVFSINKDGSIGECTDIMEFFGHGYFIHEGGQSVSHIHCLKVRGDGLIIACDRGRDKLIVLRTDDEGKLSMCCEKDMPKGYAPRYIEFSKEEDIAYICFENYPYVGVYQINDQDELLEKQLIMTMPEQYYEMFPTPEFTKEVCDENEVVRSPIKAKETVLCSDIHLNKEGNRLYVANRWFKNGEASICVFIVHQDGLLEYERSIPFECHDIRNFLIGEDDKTLYVSLTDKGKILKIALGSKDKESVTSETVLEVEKPSSIIQI